MQIDMKTDRELIGLLGNITGRVQGVGFRHYTQVKATELGLTGTVRNLTDGSVSIEAYGDSDQVKSLINWCQSGPSSSHVISFSFQFIDYKSLDYNGFRKI